MKMKRSAERYYKTCKNENIKKMLSELKDEYKNADIFTSLLHSDGCAKYYLFVLHANGKPMYPR